MSAFASTQVEDAVRSSLEAIVNKAHQPNVRSSRVRFTGDRGSNNFVWIMVDRTDITSAGSAPVEGFRVHTNDIDLFAATPPSFDVTCPTTDTASTFEAAVQFVASKVGQSARVELLLQSDFSDGTHEGNYVGDSDAGFDAVHPQPVLFTD